MSTKTSTVYEIPREHYLNSTYGIRSWLLTTDHKRIAILYLLSVTFFFFVGGIFATMIRIHLLTPAGLLVTPETYNKLFTMHGVAMIFFFLIPSIPAVLGNFLIPLMIGAKDLAFPKVNLLSWYVYVVGGCFVLYSFATGGLDTGWTFYTPLSSIYSNSAVTPAVLGIFINGFSSILTGLNFVVTVHTMRAPGMTWFRLPLFVWAHYATSIIFILGTPVIAITLLLAGLERMFHLGFFNPAWRRPDTVPASFLVLFASGGVHHDFARHGCNQRNHSYFRAQTDFRVFVYRGLQYRHRGHRILRVGSPHVFNRRIRVRRAGVFFPQLPGGHSFGC